MTLQELTAKMKEGAAKKSSFGNTVKFSHRPGRHLHRRQRQSAGRQQRRQGRRLHPQDGVQRLRRHDRRQARRHDRVHDRQAQDRRRHGRRHEAAEHFALEGAIHTRVCRKDKKLTTGPVSADTAPSAGSPHSPEGRAARNFSSSRMRQTSAGIIAASASRPHPEPSAIGIPAIITSAAAYIGWRTRA